jgi:heavy metal sensor kinase
LVEILSPDGNILYKNERLGEQTLGLDPVQDEGAGGYSPRTVHLADGTALRVVSRRHTLDGHPLLIRLAYSQQNIWSRFTELTAAWLLALPIVLALAGLAGYALARRALNPLEEMACRAETITSEQLHERLPIGDEKDELGHLARVFNNLLARLEQSFEQLRRFTADASHELRTPLTSIRSIGEVALQTDGTKAAYRDTIGSMLEEVNRLTALVENLLTISRADSGRIQLQPTIFSAMDLARESAALVDVLVEEKHQRLTVAGDEDVSLNADRVFLRQAMVNVIHNAVKYSPEGGIISVGVRRNADQSVVVEIADNGPGVAPEHVAKIFDRFYRIDSSRSREGGGAGLGLAIAQWAVRVHGGEIRLQSWAGSGSTFQILLPAPDTPVVTRMST